MRTFLSMRIRGRTFGPPALVAGHTSFEWIRIDESAQVALAPDIDPFAAGVGMNGQKVIDDPAQSNLPVRTEHTRDVPELYEDLLIGVVGLHASRSAGSHRTSAMKVPSLVNHTLPVFHTVQASSCLYSPTS